MHETEFQHFGIPGMHWYVRRYQPYPKGYRGKGKVVGEAAKAALANKPSSREQRVARKKQEIMDSGSPERLYRNRNLFTTEELNQAWRRFQVEASIRREAEERSRFGKKKTAKDYIDMTRTALNTYSGTLDDSVKVYNATQRGKKLVNLLMGTNLPVGETIDMGKKKN